MTEVESDQEYFQYFYLEDKGKYFYTARISEIEKLPTGRRGTDDYYFMELDAHMEGMVMGWSLFIVRMGSLFWCR